LAAATICCTGCIQETIEGSTHTFTFEWWVPTLTLLGGLATAPVGWILGRSGWRLFRWRGRWSLALLLFLGLNVAILMAPAMYNDRSVVDDNSFFYTTGFWWNQTVHDVKLDDLVRIRIIVEEKKGRHGRKREHYYLVFERKDGTSAKMSEGHTTGRAAARLFLKHANERGIPLVDER
jgi:hypothetical protein